MRRNRLYGVKFHRNSPPIAASRRPNNIIGTETSFKKRHYEALNRIRLAVSGFFDQHLILLKRRSGHLGRYLAIADLAKKETLNETRTDESVGHLFHFIDGNRGIQLSRSGAGRQAQHSDYLG